MAKKDIEKELRDLQSKLDNLKSEISDNSDTALLPIIKQMEDNASTLKVELYRKITPGERIQLARHPNRPTTLDYINYLITDFVQLHGDRRFADDHAMVGGIGMFEGIPVTVIGTQKGKDTKDNIKRHFGMPHPEGYRKALRLMEQAEKFGRPIINFIDTAGAYPGLGAEERGQGEAIAYNLYKMSTLKTPVISIITGEGGSGGALALAVADKVFMLTNSIYSVISPEGCASILWKDSSKAMDAAQALKIDANNLLQMGIIDGIIEEPEGGAHQDYAGMAENIKNKLRSALEELSQYEIEHLLEARYAKFRKIGVFKEG
ncbi:MAG: acetyl-CoA carboxylase carboxyltransferase subunit alpha [Spirochaetales bacterium]|nr:acetyl-CoA carboxylase carboxyltransferase subunit alpha [Spirochaetales bacterium]MBR2316512.1 acetyl-CoA carboxylase carboxyltransferase subunit alpha [Spirochaetales bacterium]